MIAVVLSSFVALVWLFHGLFNKLLGGSPRHLAIVQSVPALDGRTGEVVLTLVGVLEILLAVWILSGRWARTCAAVQTVVLLTMNVLELMFARHLLLWPAGLIPVNVVFLGFAWAAAEARHPAGLLARLRRHPLPVRAHLQDCLTLTYAVPPDLLRPLLPPGLVLETFNGFGFVAVALVQARSLRPVGFPDAFGQDFILVGYRIFTRFEAPGSRLLRGLRILRSDANRRLMVAGGNLLTHYNYRACAATLRHEQSRVYAEVRSEDGAGDIDVTANLSTPTLPEGSPFRSIREARRFAGPLPFTFDYEPETHAIIAINGRRTHWQPSAVAVEVRKLTFFDQPGFAGCTPQLAAAFHVSAVEYRWERGVRYPLAVSPLGSTT
jgi:uncharacterized membrane protein YphA (DoxX/SURF4 family)